MKIANINIDHDHLVLLRVGEGEAGKGLGSALLAGICRTLSDTVLTIEARLARH